MTAAAGIDISTGAGIPRHNVALGASNRTSECSWQSTVSSFGLATKLPREPESGAAAGGGAEIEFLSNSANSNSNSRYLEDARPALAEDSPATPIAVRLKSSPIRIASASSPQGAAVIEQAEVVSPESDTVLGAKNTPSKNAVEYLGGTKDKVDSNSAKKLKNSTMPSHELIIPVQTDGVSATPVPSPNVQNPLTASVPTPPALTAGDAERTLIQTGFESGFPKRPASTAETQTSTDSDRRTHMESDTVPSAGEQADPQSAADRCADVSAPDGPAQGALPAHAEGTFVQAENAVTHAARELPMGDSASTRPGPRRDSAVVDESTPSRLNDKSWNRPVGSLPPSNLHASIEGERHEVHAIGVHSAAKEKSQAEPGPRNSFAVQQPSLGVVHGSPALRAEIRITEGDARGVDSSKPSSASTALANPLDAMDTSTERSHPTWLHASARQAEAGFRDPTLGWIGVRAHVDSSGVHAALVPSSIEAAQSLGVHLASLNAYLAEHHTQLEKVTLAKPDTAWTDHGMQQGMNEQQGQGEEHGPGRGAARERQYEERADLHSGSLARSPVPDVSQPHSLMERPLPLGRPDSTHISLMA
jgi:hypothetical protein